MSSKFKLVVGGWCLVLLCAVQVGLAQRAAIGRGYPTHEAAAKMTLADGLQVTLCAGEPDVLQPIACCTDDRGRLWVAQNLDYPIRRGEKEANNQILIFEDTQGTGVFDKRTVFCDNVGYVSGIQVGFGGVWIGAAPHLKFIPIREGDDQPAGEAKILLDGWSRGGWHMLNNLTWGPDGWLYGCQGIAAHSAVGKPGAKPEERVKFDAGVWRYHPIRHEFELFAWGFSNPWGIDFDPNGQMILTCCIIPPVWHVIQGGRYHHQSEILYDENTYDNIKTIYWRPAKGAHNPPNWRHRPGGAPGGAVIYQGDSFPERYRGKLFSVSVHEHSLIVDRLERKGSGFVAYHESVPLLSNDIQFMGFHVEPAADGSLYLLDWHDTFTFNCHGGSPSDKQNGRIFKLSAQGVKPQPINLAKLSNDELVRLQRHPNEWVARHARRNLQERANAGTLNAETTQALVKILEEAPSTAIKLRALWTLHAVGQLGEDRLSQLLDHPEEYLRAWAIQLLNENQRTPVSAVKKFSKLASIDPSPVVRLYLASALQRLPLEQRWDIAAALARHVEDADDHNLPQLIWYGLEPLVAKNPRPALDLASEKVIPLVREFIARRLTDAGHAALLVEALHKQSDVAIQLGLLRGMSEALRGKRNLEPPAGWAALKPKLERGSSAEISSMVRTLAARFGDAKSLEFLRETAADRKEDTTVRRQALEELINIKPADVATILHEHLTDPKTCGIALRGLASVGDAKTPDRIILCYPRFSPTEKVDALAILGSRVDSAEKLLNAIKAKKIPVKDLSAHTVQILSALRSPVIDQWLKDNWGSTRQSPEEKLKEMAKWRALVNEAKPMEMDVRRGQSVFQKTCMQCHRLFDEGGSVGPELTQSARAQLDYLLHNIVDPNAEVNKAYIAWIIETKSGKTITGLVRSRDQDQVVIATAQEILTIPTVDIESMLQSDKSMMPEGLLNNLSRQEVLDLIAYLRSPGQVAPSKNEEAK